MWLKSLILLAFVISFISTKELDLSNRRLKKEKFFKELQHQKNMNLQDVTDLNLDHNEFDSFLDCSTKLEALRTLRLSYNHLQRFFFLCNDEYGLETLNVSHNLIEYIDDNALNHRISKLKVLDLSFNKLAIVNETMLEHFTVLEYLSVSNNPIGDAIHDSAFWKLKMLKHLDLRNVSAPFFSNELFKTLFNLSSLDLSWNPIDTIPVLPIGLKILDLSGTRIINLENLYLPSLRELQLNYMSNLTSLILNDFENLTRLEILSMVGCKHLNRLSLLPQNGILLPHLQALSIKECALQTLEIELRPLLSQISLFEVSNNPWKCDCKMEWINWWNSTKKFSRDIRCHSPGRHHDKLLEEIPNDELQCEHDTSVLYSVLWTCLAILIIALIFAIAFVLLRRSINQWNFRGKNPNTVTYKTVIESNNDLVRILPIVDTYDHNDE